MGEKFIDRVKKEWIIVGGLFFFILFLAVINSRENFDVNIKIGIEKETPLQKREKKRIEKIIERRRGKSKGSDGVVDRGQIGPGRDPEAVPTKYEFPEGSKVPPVKNYKPMINSINTYVTRARNDDYYGQKADTGIQRGL